LKDIVKLSLRISDCCEYVCVRSSPACLTHQAGKLLRRVKAAAGFRFSADVQANEPTGPGHAVSAENVEAAENNADRLINELCLSEA